MPSTPRLALLTGASRGLGRAAAQALAARGWDLVIDGRDAGALADARAAIAAAGPGRVAALAGDVTDPSHRSELAAEVARRGRLDLLVNNASDLGPSPLRRLAELDTGALRTILATNVVAPLALIRDHLPALRAARGVVVDVSSDAAVEPYEGWGGYGASKAALDHASAVLTAEEPSLTVYVLDPGDMRTAMHQAAFPGEDISDRPLPEAVVPALLHLLDHRPPAGRYRAADLLAPGAAAGSPA